MKFGFVTSLLILLLKVTFAFSNVPDALMEDGNFKTLVNALNKADLMTQLAGDGPFTIFAPTDDAFGKLPNGLLACLLENKDLLADILKYHVVKKKFTDYYLDYNENVKTLHGDNLSRTDAYSILNYYDKSKIVGDNVIQYADSLLVPPTVISNTNFDKTCQKYDNDICNGMKDDLNVTEWNEYAYAEQAFGITCSCQAASQQDPKVTELDRQIGARITCEDAEELCYEKECFIRSTEFFVYPDKYGLRTTGTKDCVDLNENNFGGEKFCFLDGHAYISINGETCNNYTITREIIYSDDDIYIGIEHQLIDCTNLGYDEFSVYANCTAKNINDDFSCKELNRTTSEGLISWSIIFDRDRKYTAASSGSHKFYAATNFIISIIIGMVAMY